MNGETYGEQMDDLLRQLDEIEPVVRDACLLSGNEEACDMYQRILDARIRADETEIKIAQSFVRRWSESAR